jgi:hypothetical protein
MIVAGSWPGGARVVLEAEVGPGVLLWEKSHDPVAGHLHMSHENGGAVFIEKGISRESYRYDFSGNGIN